MDKKITQKEIDLINESIIWYKLVLQGNFTHKDKQVYQSDKEDIINKIYDLEDLEKKLK